MTISKDELPTHNCIQVLCTELDHVKNELEKYKHDVNFYKTEVRTLQEFLRVLRVNNSNISGIFDHVENDEILRY